MRQTHKFFVGLAIAVACFVAAAVFGVHSARPAVKAGKSAPVSAAAVGLRVKAIPFTAVDFVLLLTGGAILLLGGSAVRRMRLDREVRSMAE